MKKAPLALFVRVFMSTSDVATVNIDMFYVLIKITITPTHLTQDLFSSYEYLSNYSSL